MFHLKDFLQKFSHLSPPDRLVKEASMAALDFGRPKVRWASVRGKTTPSRKATTG